jgi:predicted transcriptional regulator
MDTRVVTAHLPTELAEKLDDLAERLDRPKGSVVKEAIALFVALEEKRHRLTLEALADGDRKRTLDHAAVEAWAEGLAK